MIACLNCKHHNPEGSLFCAECGTQLPGFDSLATQAISGAQIGNAVPDGGPAGNEAGPNGSRPWGNLHILETGQVVPLATRTEFTLGRTSEGQPIIPDIDLSPYRAHASGVSRLHAIVKREGRRVLLTDLGSANGTFINGRRLAANDEQPLNHGDVLALGKLKIQLLLEPS
jgi:hypothetical protein